MSETDKLFVKEAMKIAMTEQELKGLLWKYSQEEAGDCLACSHLMYNQLLKEAGTWTSN